MTSSESPHVHSFQVPRRQAVGLSLREDGVVVGHDRADDSGKRTRVTRRFCCSPFLSTFGFLAMSPSELSSYNSMAYFLLAFAVSLDWVAVAKPSGSFLETPSVSMTHRADAHHPVECAKDNLSATLLLLFNASGAWRHFCTRGLTGFGVAVCRTRVSQCLRRCSMR